MALAVARHEPLDIVPEIFMPTHKVFGVGNVLVVLAADAPGVSYLGKMMQVHLEYKARFPQGQANIIIVSSKAKPPDDDTKRRLRIMMNACGGSMLVGAHVIEGDGFRSAAMRSVVTLISVMARFPFPMYVYKDVGDACLGIVTTMGDRVVPGLTASVLLSKIHEARRMLRNGSFPVPVR